MENVLRLFYLLHKMIFKNIGYKLLISFILLFSGFFIPKFAVLDGLFGLGFYIVDLVGWWKPGRSWITDNRILAIFCFYMVPIFVSFLFSIVIVEIFKNLQHRSKQSAFLFLFLIFVLIYGLQTSNYDGVSFLGYWTSNF